MWGPNETSSVSIAAGLTGLDRQLACRLLNKRQQAAQVGLMQDVAGRLS